MDSETRFSRALAAAAAPARDPAFVVSVMEAAERARFKGEAAAAMLRGGAVAGAAAALALPFASWAASNTAALQAGVLSAVGLIVLVGTARFMTQRAAALSR